MTIQGLIDTAKGGELKNLGVRNDDAAIIGFMNLGLIELYKRFPMSVEEAIISLKDGKAIYKLDGTDPDVSMSSTNEFMWAVSAYQEVEDPTVSSDVYTEEIPINDEEDEKTITTISYNQIQVPIVTTGAYISIIYVAAPTWYTTADLATTLPLPPQMIEALLHYIGYRAHGAVDGQINAENSTHYTRFEASCLEIIKLGMFTGDDMTMNNRLDDRGFA